MNRYLGSPIASVATSFRNHNTRVGKCETNTFSVARVLDGGV
jgi:hypothetical protein